MKFIKQFKKSIDKAIKYSITYIKKWQTRIVLLGLFLLFMRTGFIRLLDPYPYDYVSAELLPFPAVLFALISNGWFFVFALAIATALAISLLVSIFKNWSVILKYLIKNVKKFFEQAEAAIKWSANLIKMWQVRFVMLGIFLLSTRSGFIRLLDPYSYNYIFEEPLSLSSVILAFISNGWFFVFALCTAIVLLISLLINGSWKFWQFLRTRQKYTWDKCLNEDEIKTESMKRKRGFLIWFVSLLLLFLSTFVIQLFSDTTDTIRLLQSIGRDIILILHLKLTAVVYIINWISNMIKNKINPMDKSRKSIETAEQTSRKRFPWRIIGFIAGGFTLILLVWLIFVRDFQIVGDLVNMSVDEMYFENIFGRFWPGIVHGAATVVTMLIAGAAILFGIWFVSALIHMAKIIATKVSIYAGDYDGSKLLWLLSRPVVLLYSALAGMFEVIQNFLTSAIHIITGPRNETAKNRMLYVAAGIASIVSFFNAYLSLNEFFIGDEYGGELVLRRIIVVTLSLAIQIAVLVFGLKAGETLAEMVHLNRLKRKMKTAVEIETDVKTKTEGKPDIKGKKERLKWLGKGFMYVGLSFKRTLRYTLQIVPYLLFMIFSVYFAFTAMFSAYANHVDLRHITYYEVIRETERLLGISERIAKIENEFYDNRTFIINNIDNDVADLIRLRTMVTDYYRHEVGQRGYLLLSARENDEPYEALQRSYDEAGNDRDRFINNTRELESTVDLIKSLIDTNFADIGRLDLHIEYYHHLWIYDNGRIVPTYAYRSRAMQFYLPSVGNQVVGRRYELPVPEQFMFAEDVNVDIQMTYHTRNDGTHFRGDNDRFIAVRTSRIMPNIDKYGLLIQLYNYYIELRNLIKSEARSIMETINDVPALHSDVSSGGLDNDVTNIDDNEMQRILGNLGESQDLTSIFRDTININAQIDNIRGEIEQLYNRRSQFAAELRRNNQENDHYVNSNSGGLDNDVTNISVRDLTRVTSGMLRNLVHPRRPLGDLAFENLYFFVETSIELFTILSRFDFAEYTIADDGTNESNSVFEVRELRSYAQALAASNFYLSLDVLFRGGFGLNEETDIRLEGIYTARMIAIFFVLFAFIKDLIPFAVGLLIHKDIYTFKTEKLDNLPKMGLLVADDKLSTIFAPPKPEKLRQLHSIYSVSAL
ncbi:MAG: hypothetical protein FWC95_03120 [Defluviitaleaceae bacterium]|nr:hypothetical protein [Defluviitaleaceae bacterium]